MVHVILGLTMSVVFQLAHTVEENDFPAAQIPENIIENEWAIHQVETTANFSPKSRFASWYMGGLNFQIEHHLFAESFEALEKAVVEAFKMGFEVLEAEETEDEDGNRLLCCDATMESALNAELIDEQVEKLVNLAEKYDIIYDGWGTFYEGEDALYDEEGDEEEQ